ncbi:MAG: hypothetical protein U1E16_02195 [Hyphomicrobiales bacterium]
MISNVHYLAELALWMMALYLAGCVAGEWARRLAGRRRGRLSDAP